MLWHSNPAWLARSCTAYWQACDPCVNPVTPPQSTHPLPPRLLRAHTPTRCCCCSCCRGYLGGGGGARRAVDGVDGTLPLGVPPGLAGAAGARRAGWPDRDVRPKPAWPSTSPCRQHTNTHRWHTQVTHTGDTHGHSHQQCTMAKVTCAKSLSCKPCQPHTACRASCSSEGRSTPPVAQWAASWACPRG